MGKSASREKTQFVLNFAQILGDNGDMFFTSGDVEDDYNTIVGTLMAQGYWSGSNFRYFFDKDFNLTGIEERRFGVK